MRKILFPWSAALGAAVSLAVSSCAYDPYYSSIGGSYSSGFGDGYGYGGSNFSTSLFVSTGDSRWGYDPYTYCYYDYRSRRYYDPYLYGYYPVGYRPYALYGVPHPHGWRQGSRYCPPPRTVRNVTVVNYRNRESAYRNSDYSWARQVRQQPVRSSNRDRDDNRYNNPSPRPDSGPRPTTDRGWLNPFSRDGGQSRTRESYNRESRVAPSGGNRSRPPVQYNAPVVRPDATPAPSDRFNRGNSRDYLRTQNSVPPQFSRPDTGRPSRRVEPSVPRSRPDFQPAGGSPGSRGDFQRPQPSAPPAAAPPPASNDQPSRGEGRGRLRSLGEG
jgi:hypothetical protein